jgi:DNA-binding transcriptional LysR family regulator
VHIDFLGIQAFLAVAECGTFGLAAARLHLTQAAVSHRMRKLEESLGVQLIVRTSRGATLTQAGEAMLPRARQSVIQLEESLAVARTSGQVSPAWVTLACLPTVAAGVLVHALHRAEALLPGVRIRVFDSSPGEIVELVQAGTCAFGLTLEQSAPAGLRMEPVARERFVLVCPREHALAELPSVDWSTLESESLIRISLPSGNSATIDETLGPFRERLKWVYETQRTAMALQMVRAGLGLTVVPALAVSPQDELAVVPLCKPEIGRMLVLLTPEGVPLMGAPRLIADTFVTLIQQHTAIVVS